MISIYKASAGSGKTYTLAYRYIKMLLGRQLQVSGDYRLNPHKANRHRSLLAITFTNKATEEMKHRIIHELAVLAGAEPGWTAPSPYIDDLCAELHATPSQVADEARRALSEILFDYGRFQVSTIDSFFQQVLRTFAREADQTGNYEVDLDDDALIALALARLFRSISYPSPEERESARRTKAWLLRYFREQMRQGKSIDILNRGSKAFDTLRGFIRKSLDEKFASHEAEMTAYLSNPDNISIFATRVEESLAAATERMTSLCAKAYTLIADIPFAKSRVVDAFKKYSVVQADFGKISTYIPKVAEDPAEAFNSTKKKADIAAKEAFLADSTLTSALCEAARAVVDYFSILPTAKAIQDNIYFLGLLSDVVSHMGEVRRENNTILLSDTNMLLRKVIGTDETPFLYERMGVRLEHFLIDEFQDTSRMQWENLKPLLAEGLATDRDSLIIGDEKQCIYRFRSSDPTLLQSGIARDFPGRAAIDGKGKNTNWRSSATVVDFNNRFFQAAACSYDTSLDGLSCGFGEIYHNVVQEISPAHKSHTGYIDIARVATNEAGYERSADAIARQITEGGYMPIDIAVLFRRKKEAQEFIQYLLIRQVTDPAFPRFRIISDDSITVGSSNSVKLVISNLRSLLLLRPGEEEAVEIEEKRAHSHTLGEDVLARLVNDFEFFSRDMDRSEALGKAVALACSAEADDPAHAPLVDTAMVCPSLPSLVDRIIAGIVKADVMEADHAFIAALQDVVSEYSARHGSDLRGFLDWWDRKGAYTPVSSRQDDNSLRVMTIHKSKGLEFKCIHIPAANWELHKFIDPEWFDVPPEGVMPGVERGITPPILPLVPSSTLTPSAFGPQYERRVAESDLDELNTLYVAFTRAIDELIVSYVEGTAKYLGKKIGTVLTSMGATSEGCYIEGEPTKARQTKGGPRTALEPSGEPVAIPPLIPSDTPSIWSRTRLDTLRVDPLTAPGRGIMLHDVMSRIRHRSDMPRALRTMAARGVVPHAEVPALEEMLASLLDTPGVEPWFEGYKRLMVERAIAIGERGEEHRRPDRVVWTADGHIDVIDYKTGKSDFPRHARQVKGYMRQLASLGYDPAALRGFIWYLDTAEIMEVCANV
ncbi:MAG: UvrD-helicase domain-containing protein [Pseudoflavonifractor sp.]|nr:UvrD-helicase domain-containing protein [Alloprevotella sp.]MCM1117610.1 UvrD-helicase domain-containing protein [Pseudoflavonifractor sp.]